jgi:hypothetical protein
MRLFSVYLKPTKGDFHISLHKDGDNPEKFTFYHKKISYRPYA